LEVFETLIPGCFELKPKTYSDKRGIFTKVFQKSFFLNLGLEINYEEDYYSHSFQNVIRGMHFQMIPKAHNKLVYCIQGEVLDVVVDLRIGSPTFGRSYSTVLSSSSQNIIYIPLGLAHGFLTLSKFASLIYKVGTEYESRLDHGIKWDSIGFNWPIDNPIISERDNSFPMLIDFNSPFSYVHT
jgi:dTDP-4-dehydrorhamnose 3,5-epimerase